MVRSPLSSKAASPRKIHLSVSFISYPRVKFQTVRMSHSLSNNMYRTLLSPEYLLEGKDRIDFFGF